MQYLYRFFTWSPTIPVPPPLPTFKTIPLVVSHNVQSIVTTIDLFTEIQRVKSSLKQASENPRKTYTTLWDVRKKILELRPLPPRIVEIVASPARKFESVLRAGRRNLKPI